MGLGPALASADTRTFNRKKALCSLLGLGLLRTAPVGRSEGTRAGRLSCACPVLAWQGGSGAFWVRALPPHVMCGRASAAGFLPALLCPPPTGAQARPASESGKTPQEKYKGPRQAPLVSGKMAAQSGGKWWAAKNRHQNYTKGKTGRAQEIKQQGKVLYLTPTLSYFHFPRREFCHPEPSAKCLLRVHAEAYSHQGTPNRAELELSAASDVRVSLLVGSTDVQALERSLGGEGP